MTPDDILLALYKGETDPRRRPEERRQLAERRQALRAAIARRDKETVAAMLAKAAATAATWA